MTNKELLARLERAEARLAEHEHLLGLVPTTKAYRLAKAQEDRRARLVAVYHLPPTERDAAMLALPEAERIEVFRMSPIAITRSATGELRAWCEPRLERLQRAELTYLDKLDAGKVPERVVLAAAPSRIIERHREIKISQAQMRTLVRGGLGANTRQDKHGNDLYVTLAFRNATEHHVMTRDALNVLREIDRDQFTPGQGRTGLGLHEAIDAGEVTVSPLPPEQNRVHELREILGSLGA